MAEAVLPTCQLKLPDDRVNGGIIREGRLRRTVIDLDVQSRHFRERIEPILPLGDFSVQMTPLQIAAMITGILGGLTSLSIGLFGAASAALMGAISPGHHLAVTFFQILFVVVPVLGIVGGAVVKAFPVLSFCLMGGSALILTYIFSSMLWLAGMPILLTATGALLSFIHWKNSEGGISPSPLEGTLSSVAKLSADGQAISRSGYLLSALLPNGQIARTAISQERSSCTIGRSREQADFVIDDDTVSRVHAQLNLRDGDLWLSDMGSTNGTRLASLVVGASPERVRLGDRITVGSVILTVSKG
jgi:hypothetical protein